MVKSGNTTGALAFVDTNEEFNVWSPLAVIRTNPEKVIPQFAFYSMQSDFFQRSVQLSWSQGTQPNIGMGVIENLQIAVASLAEQERIVAFLDHETAKIDTLIEKQQQLIKLLKEKRQAVISHAVTKGLNPNVPMKDSGVEWLGEVPAHWNISKFSYCTIIRSGQVDPTTSPYADYILIAPNHIESGTGKILYLETAAEQGADSGKYLCLEGEIIYSKIRPNLAKACISPNDQTICSADMYPISGMNGLTNAFLYWTLLSDWFTCLVILESDRVAMPKINREKLAEILIPIPPEPEQAEISNYILKYTASIDGLIDKAEQAILLSNERRTALISAAVTGKIDVRDWQPPTSADTTPSL